MVQYHLKRLATPKTWLIGRKQNKFIGRPKGSGHSYKLGTSIVTVFRDLLGVVDSAREMRYILFNKELFVDNRKIKSHKFLTGLFDVISIPESDFHYRIVLNDKRRVDVLPVDKKEANLKIRKVISKTMIKGGKVQLNFNDGFNLITDQKCAVADTILFDTTKNEIKEVLPLKENVPVVLLSGQYLGKTAIVEKVDQSTVFVKFKDKSYETLKDFVFVIGAKEPVITATKKDDN